eukprot:s44_g3.t1
MLAGRPGDDFAGRGFPGRSLLSAPFPNALQSSQLSGMPQVAVIAAFGYASGNRFAVVAAFRYASGNRFAVVAAFRYASENRFAVVRYASGNRFAVVTAFGYASGNRFAVIAAFRYASGNRFAVVAAFRYASGNCFAVIAAFRNVSGNCYADLTASEYIPGGCRLIAFARWVYGVCTTTACAGAVLAVGDFGEGLAASGTFHLRSRSGKSERSSQERWEWKWCSSSRAMVMGAPENGLVYAEGAWRPYVMAQGQMVIQNLEAMGASAVGLSLAAPTYHPSVPPVGPGHPVPPPPPLPPSSPRTPLRRSTPGFNANATPDGTPVPPPPPPTRVTTSGASVGGSASQWEVEEPSKLVTKLPALVATKGQDAAVVAGDWLAQLEPSMSSLSSSAASWWQALHDGTSARSAEKAYLLRFLTAPETGNSVDAALTLARKWVRLLRRGKELQVVLPDPSFAVGWTSFMVRVFAGNRHPSPPFRIASFKLERQLDYKAMANDVEDYAQLILGELEAALLSHPLAPPAKLNRLEEATADAGKGKAKGKGKQPCWAWTDGSGCKYGTLVTERPTAPILAMSDLMEIGCRVLWSSGEGCRITHPVRGDLPTRVVNGCPELEEKLGLELIDEAEAIKFRRREAEIMVNKLVLSCQLEAKLDWGLGAKAVADLRNGVGAAWAWLHRAFPEAPAWLAPAWLVSAVPVVALMAELKFLGIGGNESGGSRRLQWPFIWFCGKERGTWKSRAEAAHVITVDQAEDLMADDTYAALLDLALTGK